MTRRKLRCSDGDFFRGRTSYARAGSLLDSCCTSGNSGIQLRTLFETVIIYILFCHLKLELNQGNPKNANLCAAFEKSTKSCAPAVPRPLNNGSLPIVKGSWLHFPRVMETPLPLQGVKCGYPVVQVGAHTCASQVRLWANGELSQSEFAFGWCLG